jgi:hypothetical protein
LLEAGASQEKASRAAEELATYESRPAHIDARLSLLTWMVGTVIALVVTVMFKLFH